MLTPVLSPAGPLKVETQWLFYFTFFLHLSSIPPWQWFSAFLTLWLFNTVPHVAVIPDHKIILLMLHTCSFATVLNLRVNICYAGYLICNPCQTTGWDALIQAHVFLNLFLYFWQLQTYTECIVILSSPLLPSGSLLWSPSSSHLVPQWLHHQGQWCLLPYDQSLQNHILLSVTGSQSAQCHAGPHSSVCVNSE